MSLSYTLSPKIKNLTRNEPSVAEKTVSDQLQNLNKWLGSNIASIIDKLDDLKLSHIEEIRLRVNQPLLLHTAYGDVFVTPQGKRGTEQNAYKTQQEDLLETIERMTQSSVYAAQDYLKQGYITLPGGHRVGVTGKAVMENGEVQIIKYITALNIRVAREFIGQTDIIPLLFKDGAYGDKDFCHTLIISPPRSGKTTLLRAMIKKLSNGLPEWGISGKTVGVVDERSEIAGMWQGMPTYNLGLRTDVLDGCSKSKGIMMLIRSMAPQIIATDELGHHQDIDAIAEALRCGVRILSTAHANSLDEALTRPVLGVLLRENFFERLVILSRRKGPGTVEGVIDLKTLQTLRR